MRIGFDMDGVLADFEAAFRDVEARLFGSAGAVAAGPPETAAAGADDEDDVTGTEAEPDEEAIAAGRLAAAREERRRRVAVWRAIRATPNFWESLAPIDEGAVRRIHELMLRHRWEVFFITQRPATEGDTVQRQTQRWLVRHGFDLPSVLVVAGRRGLAAAALQLDYHVDDNSQNCLDLIADSKARPILILPRGDAATAIGARQLGILTVAAIGEALDVLEKTSTARSEPGLLARIAEAVGWK